MMTPETLIAKMRDAIAQQGNTRLVAVIDANHAVLLGIATTVLEAHAAKRQRQAWGAVSQFLHQAKEGKWGRMAGRLDKVDEAVQYARYANDARSKVIADRMLAQDSTLAVPDSYTGFTEATAHDAVMLLTEIAEAHPREVGRIDSIALAWAIDRAFKPKGSALFTTAPENYDFGDTTTVERFVVPNVPGSWRKVMSGTAQTQAERYRSGLYAAREDDPRLDLQMQPVSQRAKNALEASGLPFSQTTPRTASINSPQDGRHLATMVYESGVFVIRHADGSRDVLSSIGDFEAWLPVFAEKHKAGNAASQRDAPSGDAADADREMDARISAWVAGRSMPIGTWLRAENLVEGRDDVEVMFPRSSTERVRIRYPGTEKRPSGRAPIWVVLARSKSGWVQDAVLERDESSDAPTGEAALSEVEDEVLRRALGLWDDIDRMDQQIEEHAMKRQSAALARAQEASKALHDQFDTLPNGARQVAMNWPLRRLATGQFGRAPAGAHAAIERAWLAIKPHRAAAIGSFDPPDAAVRDVRRGLPAWAPEPDTAAQRIVEDLWAATAYLKDANALNWPSTLRGVKEAQHDAAANLHGPILDFMRKVAAEKDELEVSANRVALGLRRDRGEVEAALAELLKQGAVTMRRSGTGSPYYRLASAPESSPTAATSSPSPSPQQTHQAVFQKISGTGKNAVWGAYIEGRGKVVNVGDNLVITKRNGAQKKAYVAGIIRADGAGTKVRISDSPPPAGTSSEPEIHVAAAPEISAVSDAQLEAMKVLVHIIYGTSSSYRADAVARSGFGDYSASNPWIQALVAKGWVKVSRSGAISVTPAGKNVKSNQSGDSYFYKVDVPPPGVVSETVAPAAVLSDTDYARKVLEIAGNATLYRAKDLLKPHGITLGDTAHGATSRDMVIRVGAREIAGVNYATKKYGGRVPELADDAWKRLLAVLRKKAGVGAEHPEFSPFKPVWLVENALTPGLRAEWGGELKYAGPYLASQTGDEVLVENAKRERMAVRPRDLQHTPRVDPDSPSTGKAIPFPTTDVKGKLRAMVEGWPPGTERLLTELTQDFRGVHFRKIEEAAEDLAAEYIVDWDGVRLTKPRPSNKTVMEGAHEARKLALAKLLQDDQLVRQAVANSITNFVLPFRPALENALTDILDERPEYRAGIEQLFKVIPIGIADIAEEFQEHAREAVRAGRTATDAAPGRTTQEILDAPSSTKSKRWWAGFLGDAEGNPVPPGEVFEQDEDWEPDSDDEANPVWGSYVLVLGPYTTQFKAKMKARTTPLRNVVLYTTAIDNYDIADATVELERFEYKGRTVRKVAILNEEADLQKKRYETPGYSVREWDPRERDQAEARANEMRATRDRQAAEGKQTALDGAHKLAELLAEQGLDARVWTATTEGHPPRVYLAKQFVTIGQDGSVSETLRGQYTFLRSNLAKSWQSKWDAARAAYRKWREHEVASLWEQRSAALDEPEAPVSVAPQASSTDGAPATEQAVELLRGRIRAIMGDYDLSVRARNIMGYNGILIDWFRLKPGERPPNGIKENAPGFRISISSSQHNTPGVGWPKNQDPHPSAKLELRLIAVHGPWNGSLPKFRAVNKTRSTGTAALDEVVRKVLEWFQANTDELLGKA